METKTEMEPQIEMQKINFQNYAGIPCSATVLNQLQENIKQYIDTLINNTSNSVEELKTQTNGIINGQKILKDNLGMFMHGDQMVTLPENEKISDQNNGIMLIFSGYSNGQVQDNNFTSLIILKEEIKRFNQYGHTVFLGGTDGLVGFKYLYIHDDHITGNNVNDKEIGQYKNNRFVLRTIIGF